MNRIHDHVRTASLLAFYALLFPAGILIVVWSLYLPAWITAGQLLWGLQFCTGIAFGGLISAPIWLVFMVIRDALADRRRGR